MNPIIESHRKEILQLAEANGVTNVRLFGSMARGDAGPDSDVDFLVDLAPGKSGLALGGFLEDVSELLHRRVDVVTEKALHPKTVERVMREVVQL